MKSIYNHLVDWNNSDPDFIFLNHNKSYTISDVLYEVDSISKSLEYIADNFVGIHINSSIDTIFLYLACIKTKKTPVLFHTSWSKKQLDYLINKYKIKHIISEWKNKKIFDQDVTMYYLEELINSSRGCGIPIDSNSNLNPECILFTSGSTGFPKAVSLDSNNFYYSSIGWNQKIKFNNTDIYTLCLPIFHISGLSIIYRAIYNKFSILILDSYRDLISYQGTIISLVPSVLNRLVWDPDYIEKLSIFRAIIIGGEPAEASLLQKCLDMDLNIFVSYGMTETCSGISGFWIKDYPNKLLSAGKAFDDVRVSVVDDYIVIDSKMNTMGYYMDKAIEGPVVTSDIGKIENDFIYLEGRDANIAISGGENINIDSLKDILLEHDSIKSVSLKVTKNKEWGELIEADLILSSNKLNIDDIKNWCRSRIPQYSIPKIIRIVTK